MIIPLQRADQTIDGTIVCETGVIANLFAERVPLSPPKNSIELNARLSFFIPQKGTRTARQSASKRKNDYSTTTSQPNNRRNDCLRDRRDSKLVCGASPFISTTKKRHAEMRVFFCVKTLKRDYPNNAVSKSGIRIVFVLPKEGGFQAAFYIG